MVDTFKAGRTNSVVPLAARNPTPLGEGLGRGLGALGETLTTMARRDAAAEEQIAASEHRIAMEELRRQRSQRIAESMGALAVLQRQTGTAIDELRTKKAQPGAAGHEAAAATAYAEAAEAFLAPLRDDPEVHDRFSPMVAGWRERGIAAEEDWARGQRAAFQGEQVDKLDAEMRNGLLTKPDPLKLVENLDALDLLLDGMDLTPDDRGKVRDRVEKGQYAAMLNGYYLNGQWQAADAMIQSGKLDSVLTPEQKKEYLSRGQAEADRAARQAELAQEQALEPVREQLKTYKVMIDNGDDVPPGDLAAALEAARAAGMPASELATYTYLSEGAVQVAEMRGMTDAQLAATARDLRRRQSEGALDDKDSRLLERVEKTLKGRDDNKGQQLAPLLKGSAEDRLTALAELNRMPLSQRWSVAAAAGDERAAIIAGLVPQARLAAVQGAAVRKGRDDDFLPPKTAAQTSRQRLDGVFRAVVGEGLARDLGPHMTALQETALDIMAQKGAGWSEHDYGRAVQVVFGMTQRPDGTNQGGLGTIHGRKVELPDKWTTGEFATRYARHAFPDAVYADGTAARPADVRAHFRLQYAGDNEAGEAGYMLIGPDGRQLMARTSKGLSPYVLRVPVKP